MAVLAVLPYFFKDKIKATIDEQLASSVNADVLYDIDNFSLSIFRHFPNITAGVEELRVVGRDKFEGDVLFAVRDLEVEINLGKIIFEDQLSIQGIYIDEPHIMIKVLKDGSANYDISIPDSTTTESADTASSDLQIGIDFWKITNGTIVYDDATIPFYIELDQVNHEGKGDFSLSVFDLITKTEAYVKDMSYDGVSYVANRRLKADATLNMDLDNMKFTFKDNNFYVNDFNLGLDGWLAMPADPIDMDIKFKAKNNSFKSLISLIPAIYSKDFDQLTAAGNVSFSGSVKGRYDEHSMPSFSIRMGVQDGMFQYPDLPDAVSHVQMNLEVLNKDGNLDHTAINMDRLHLELGKNPIDASVSIGNLLTYPVEAKLSAKVDLANIGKFYPVEGLTLKGQLEATAQINGTYDSIQQTIPKIHSTVKLDNGYIKYSDLPAAIDGLTVVTAITNETGKMADTHVDISTFEAKVGSSPIKGRLQIAGLENYHWDTEMNGQLNFDELFPIINQFSPMPGTTLGGQIDLLIKSKGNMKDLDAGRYDRLPASGKITFDNFIYRDSVSLPQGATIKLGSFQVTPKEMRLNNLKVIAGKSDFLSDGSLSNYLNFALKENEVLSGNLRVQSDNVDLNEWMSEETGSESSDTSSYSVIVIPGNIDFTLQANLKKILYENIELKNARGTIIIKDGVVNLKQLRTSTLGGSIVFNGSYDSRDTQHPTFDMGLAVKSLSIQQSFNAFNTVQSLAPIAQHVIGDVSTDFSIKGALKQDMMPDLTSISGKGLLEISKAALSKAGLVNGLTQFTNAKPSKEVTFKDLLLSTKIDKGRLSVSPFDVPISGFKANIAGSTGLDGSLDYVVSMKVPAGQIGSQVNALLGSVTGNQNTSDEVTINVGMGGTYNKPVFSLKGAKSKDLVKKAVTHQVAKLVGGDDAKADSIQAALRKDSLRKKVEAQKAEAARIAKARKDSLEKAAKQQLDSAKKKATDEISKKLNSLFKKKKN